MLLSADNPVMLEYHDHEWGVPVHNDRKHFEFILLSGAQAGLNFSVVLNKREGYRRAFDKFDSEKVARYSEARIQKLVGNPEIIRNRMKIEAAVRNARAFLKTQEEFGDFDSYCWRFVGGRPKLNRWKATGQIPATSPESDAFSKDLKQRGFSLVGSTVVYAYMQSVGMVKRSPRRLFSLSRDQAALENFRSKREKGTRERKRLMQAIQLTKYGEPEEGLRLAEIPETDHLKPVKS